MNFVDKDCDIKLYLLFKHSVCFLDMIFIILWLLRSEILMSLYDGILLVVYSSHCLIMLLNFMLFQPNSSCLKEIEKDLTTCNLICNPIWFEPLYDYDTKPFLTALLLRFSFMCPTISSVFHYFIFNWWMGLHIMIQY